MGVIKLQLLCGVRIEIAIGSLPYPGNYLDLEFASPLHAVFFITNKVKIKLVMFLIFSQIFYGFVS